MGEVISEKPSEVISEKPVFVSNFEPSLEAERVLRTGRILGEDETPQRMIERVVQTLFVEPEKKFGTSNIEIEAMMIDFGYLLDNKYIVMSTPVMTNAGRYPDRPLSACTVPPVDLKGDLSKMRELITRFHEDGMGTGFNLTDVDDPVSLLRFLNDVAVEGAESGREDRPVGNMAILSVYHPRIKDFIDAKLYADDKGERWIFNISVDVDQQFMDRAVNDEEYVLMDGTRLNAGDVLRQIARNAHQCADPGLIMLTRMEDDNPTPSIGRYVSTAPCAEVGLAPGESCQFGYLNLGRFVQNGEINFELLEKAIRLLTRALDNALEVSLERYPAEENRRLMGAKRKIGIGVCGVADLLLIRGIPYDSQEAYETIRDLVAFINYISKLESHELAKIRGPFGAMYSIIGNRYLEGEGFIKRKYGQLKTKYVSSGDFLALDQLIKETHLLRNASTTALPPTGRSALVIDASTGIEPLFSLLERDGSINPILRNVLSNQGLLTDVIVGEIRRTGTVKHISQIPENIRRVFRTALEIRPEDHIAMVAEVQRAVDESISKTINLPESATVEDVLRLFLIAYRSGLKGITVYRSGSRRIQPKNLTKV